MKKNLLKYLVILSVIFTACISAAQAQEWTCPAEKPYYNIFSLTTSEGRESSCVDSDFLSYPHCSVEGKGMLIIPCSEGCNVDKCNLEFDENHNGLYEITEILKLIKEYSGSDMGKIIIESALNYWREQ